MARNLREKIHAIVNDAYDLRQPSVITKIENLIKDEMQLRDEEREITHYDLTYIQSVAVKEMTDMRLDAEHLGKIAGDQGLVRTLCFVNAITGFLRQRGLLSALLKYKK